eukprot:GHVS01053005.1.p1 GENE.GHVS01053005.1~~GHVS01053005.1.p1  ORF type:complete len:340 (-),score=44.57 GHVS01053005.1:474-1493(-)
MMTGLPLHHWLLIFVVQLLADTYVSLETDGSDGSGITGYMEREEEMKDVETVREEDGLGVDETDKVLSSLALRGIYFPPPIAALSPIPLDVSGRCLAGEKFTIDSISALQRQRGRWECVFRAGVVPKEIPVGRFRGRILKVFNNAIYASIAYAATSEQYHQIIETACPKDPLNKIFITMTGVANLPVPLLFGILTLGKLGGLAEEEYTPPYSPDGLIIDFRKDLSSICAPPNAGSVGPPGAILQGPFRANPPVGNKVVNVSRIVGRDRRTGDYIWLQKALLEDRQTKRLYTVAHDVWTIGHHAGHRNLKRGFEIGPVDESFSYLHNSKQHAIKATFPFV